MKQSRSRATSGNLLTNMTRQSGGNQYWILILIYFYTHIPVYWIEIVASEILKQMCDCILPMICSVDYTKIC